MAGFQFVHMQSFGRKPLKGGASTGFVFSEAKREMGFCSHVENPAEPIKVYGASIEEVEAMHNERAESATLTRSDGKIRKVRADQHTLLTVIASHPATPEQMKADPTIRLAVEKWQELNLRWLQKQYGNQLVSLIRHDDESHVHLHAYVLPENSQMKARVLHPGQEAKEESLCQSKSAGIDSKIANKLGDQAYKKAMREWQDEYWQHVGISSGLTRLGAGKRRQTREEKKLEQAQVENVAKLQALAEQVQPVIDRGTKIVAALHSQVDEAKLARDEALRLAEIAKVNADIATKNAKTIIDRANRKATVIVVKAMREGQRLKAFGSLIGNIFQGIIGSSPSKVIEYVQAEEREKFKAKEHDLLSINKDIRKTLADTSRQRDEARESLIKAVRERDALAVSQKSNRAVSRQSTGSIPT